MGRKIFVDHVGFLIQCWTYMWIIMCCGLSLKLSSIISDLLRFD
jgi:hypothetical protein